MAEHPINPPVAVVNPQGQLLSVVRPLSELSSSFEERGALRWLAGVTWAQFEHLKPLVQAATNCDGPDFTVGGDGFVSDAFGVNGDHDGDTFVQPAFTVYRALTEGTLCHTEAELEAASDYQLAQWISMAIAEELITAAASGGMGLRNSARKVTGAGSTLAHRVAGLIEAYSTVAGVAEGLVHSSIITSLVSETEALALWGGGPTEGDVSGRYTPVVDLAYTSLIMNGIAGFTNDEIFLSGPVYLAMARVQDLTHTDISTNRIEVLQQTHAILVFDPMTVVAIESTATQSALTIGAPPQAN